MKYAAAKIITTSFSLFLLVSMSCAVFGSSEQWITYGGENDDEAAAVVASSDGGYAITGTTKPTDNETHYDIWFTKTDTQGEIIPEFPSWLFLPLYLTGLLIVVILKGKTFHQKI